MNMKIIDVFNFGVSSILVIFLRHADAWSHVAKVTMQKLTDMEYGTLPHPPYFPDLSHTEDRGFFQGSRNVFRQRRFPSK